MKLRRDRSFDFKLISDPAIADKVCKMEQRVRWHDPAVIERKIDQTSLVLDDGQAEDSEFSFLVVGDSGSRAHRDHHPQRKVAELMLPHHAECRFMLHTGDVIYLVGSSEYYNDNFIEPYQEFLVGGDRPKKISYDRMTFSLPILPVLGNHDYYDLPLFSGLISLVATPARFLLRSRLEWDVGWQGSKQGDAYARAFLDYLKALSPEKLAHHLDQHYTASMNDRRCLHYQPGHFTRLPNRYYTFRYGGIDFFALDSNTFNAPSPLPTTQEGKAYRQQLEQRCELLRLEKIQILEKTSTLNPANPEEADQLDDLRVKLSQVDEVQVDIIKQLASTEDVTIDWEQLDWLKERLITSWQTNDVRGRVLYFHHPPYVTEATKWQQSQTLAVRDRLRYVLDGVAKEIGDLAQGRPLVDLVLTGHAHCLEHLKTLDTGHADSNINWIICGGSGYSLRRQRPEGAELRESFSEGQDNQLLEMAAQDRSDRPVANSHLFIGRSGRGTQKRRPYSSLRIDVKAGNPPKFVVQPLVAEWHQHRWHEQDVKPFMIE
ncbi:MAG: metallophosphoesterase [Cyanobacteria bacterium CAN_BIN43]|nr:metallophosphoesterase [Cyanobacteria bacterium CAN_BIN43]